MIKGVFLQNFMSYEDAYIPLTNGLNLICGPNGAGKSSILLGISIVLGQSYTERAKKVK
jgi:DNA repair exonuclease SbcCD ATPase subunit